MYIFKKLRDERNRFDITEVEHKTETVSCSDLCESFYYYLLACGFSSEVAVSGMQYVLDQYEKRDEEQE